MKNQGKDCETGCFQSKVKLCEQEVEDKNKEPVLSQIILVLALVLVLRSKVVLLYC